MSGYRMVALTASTAVFMQFLDATALNTALPAMARDLHVQAIDLNVAILSYQIAMAALIPIGSLAIDRFGARNAFALALLVFLSGSLLCACSHSLPTLVAARAWQGFGGAMMMPISRELVIRSAAKHEMMSALNWLLIPGILGPLLGPVVGGLMVTYANWRWIFLINVPVALAGIALTFALVPYFAGRLPRRIDFKGILLIAITIIAMIVGLERAAMPDAGILPGALLLCGLLFGWLYVRHADGNADAIFDLDVLNISSFRASMLIGAMLRMIVGATGFLLPLWFQLAMGMSALRVGPLLVMGAAAALCSRLFCTWLMRHAHPKPIVLWATTALVMLLLAEACLRPSVPFAVFYLILFAQGVAVSIPLMIVGAIAFVDVSAEQIGAATGFHSMVQQLTLSLGVTAAVSTIGMMRRLAHTGPKDGLTYSGSLIMLAGLALAALYVSRRVERPSFGALRREASTVS